MGTTASQRAESKTIKSYIPIVELLPAYKNEWLRPNVIVALTVWAKTTWSRLFD